MEWIHINKNIVRFSNIPMRYDIHAIEAIHYSYHKYSICQVKNTYEQISPFSPPSSFQIYQSSVGTFATILNSCMNHTSLHYYSKYKYKKNTTYYTPHTDTSKSKFVSYIYKYIFIRKISYRAFFSSFLFFLY